jgi:hypothetical protein
VCSWRSFLWHQSPGHCGSVGNVNMPVWRVCRRPERRRQVNISINIPRTVWINHIRRSSRLGKQGWYRSWTATGTQNRLDIGVIKMTKLCNNVIIQGTYVAVPFTGRESRQRGIKYGVLADAPRHINSRASSALAACQATYYKKCNVQIGLALAQYAEE